MRTKLILERLDKDYHLLERREQLSRSWLRNFINLLYIAHAQLTGAAPYTMNDITNTPRTVDSQSESGIQSRNSKSNLRMGSPGGISGVLCSCGHLTYMRMSTSTIEAEKIGIVVGTGANPVIPTDPALQTRVTHGRGVGQLEYGGCELVGIAFADPNGQFTFRRYFTNLSGGGIVIQEVGIYTIGTDYGSAAMDSFAWPFCVFRDVVAAVTVNDTEILRASILPQITV